MQNNIVPNLLSPTHPEGDHHITSYVLRVPADELRSGLIVSCPHAGILVPKGFEKRLHPGVKMQEILARGDRWTDWLSISAPEHGAVQLISKAAPSFLNVGRSEHSLYAPDILGGPGSLFCDPNDIYCSDGQGQGLISMYTLHDQKPIYDPGAEPDEIDILRRLNNYYHPFHDQLETQVKNALAIHGRAVVADFHSCPSIGTPTDRDPGEERADIIISNADWRSCSEELMYGLKDLAAHYSLSCTFNTPYSGGFITQKYGAHNPVWGPQNCESVQFEFNRYSMGVDEKTMAIDSTRRFKLMQNYADEAMAVIAAYNLERTL